MRQNPGFWDYNMLTLLSIPSVDPGGDGHRNLDNMLDLTAQERLFFGGGKDEDEDYFGYYDYHFGPPHGDSPGPGPSHHFMDRDGPDTDYDTNLFAGFSFTEFLQSLFNLRH